MQVVDDKPQTTICPWEAYEREIYSEVAFIQKRNRIAATIGTWFDGSDNLPRPWHGTIQLANAIMKVIDNGN